MAMAVCSVCVMLTLLASGSIATGAGLDTSAMIQVVADVMAGDASSARLGFDSHSEFDEAATVELVFGAVLGTPSELTGSQDFGDREALVHASKELAKAWTEDASRLARETAKLALKRRESSSFAALEPHLDGTEAFEEIGNNARAGKMDWQQLNWVQKMSESHAAMTAHMMDKNMDWQKLAADISLLQTKARTEDPDGDISKMKKHFEKAVNIAVNKGLEDAVMLRNMTKTFGEAWKNIAMKCLADAADKRFKKMGNMFKKGARDKADYILKTATGGKIQATTDVDGTIRKWLDDYINHGKISYAAMDVIRKMMERSGTFATLWADRSMNFAQDAIGSFLALGTQALDEDEEYFGSVKVFSEAPVEIDEDVAGNVAEIVQRHMKEMGRKQDELAAAGEQSHEMPEQLSDSVKRGDLQPEALANLQASTEDSGRLARMWVENTADLQKLVAGVFMVMSQKTSPAGRTVVDDVKRDFERVMLKQEQLVSRQSSDSEQEALLPEGRLRLESLQRVQTIADHSREMASQWLERNQANRQLTSAVLLHLAAQQ